MTALAPILEAFFIDRLMTQQAASPHTLASYRDTFKLLLGYLHTRTGKLPAQLELTDLDATVIGDFLHHLETGRGNTIASRNTRLAAIHSLFRYASLQAPQHANLISRVLAIQTKRRPRRPDRPARLRNHRPDHRRCPPGHRCPRLLPRQRPQRPVHTADHPHPANPRRLA